LCNNSLLNVKSIISASGNWSIDENGYLAAKKITAEEYEIDARKKGEADATLGRATVPVGMSEILVNNNRVKKNSNIVVTFYGNPGGSWWISNQEDGWFKVTLSTGTGSEIDFRYWIQSVILDEAPAEPSISNSQFPISNESGVSAASAAELVAPESPQSEAAPGDSVAPSQPDSSEVTIGDQVAPSQSTTGNLGAPSSSTSTP